MTMIDSKDMRARVLARMERATSEAVDWQKALAADGNRQLLGLIIERSPGSISELTEWVGRAQPNVSRSLATLVRAGLVDLRQNGRVSTPTATQLGLEKAKQIGVAGPGIKEAPDRVASGPHMTVSIDPASVDPSQVLGELRVQGPTSGGKTISGFCRADMTLLAERWTADWWRILYRRDSPYRLCDLSIGDGGLSSDRSISVSSLGCHVALTAWPRGGEVGAVEPISCRLSIHSFQANLCNGMFAPIAKELVRRREVDRPLHSALARIEEIENDQQERTYWRTAGALDLRLGDHAEDVVSRLIEDMPDEEARLEFASSVLPEDVNATREWIRCQSSSNGERNRMSRLEALADRCPASEGNLRPFQRGIALAKCVRELLCLAPDRSIGGLTGLALAMGAPGYTPGGDIGGASEVLLGFRSDDRGAPSIFVDGSHGAEATTFLLARGIGDCIAFGGKSAPITDLWTDRQAVGRAFAAELIAPSRAVVTMIDEGQPLQRVARHFGATAKTIRHQYQNNSYLAV